MIDVIHIGYAKSASTFLQKAFEAHPDLDCVNARPITRPLLFDDENVFAVEQLRRLVLGGNDRVRILSDEGLCGWSFFYNYARIARRLSATFPDARILIIVREQVSFLESLYRHELRFGYGFSPERFIQAYCSSRHVFHGLAYDRVLTEYSQRFENVHMALMERLVGPDAEREALDALYKFLGVSAPQLEVSRAENVGMSAASVHLTQYINRYSASKLQMFDKVRIYNSWRYRWSRRVDRLARRVNKNAEFSFSGELRDEIREHFVASNAELAKALDVDVSRFGYAVK